MILGVLKNHWYNTWILRKTLRANTAAKKRELDLIHEHLANVRTTVFTAFLMYLSYKFEMPSFVARPAKAVGEPAGGGLSADTYKGLGTVFLPTIVCPI